jgi:hypothetical protein
MALPRRIVPFTNRAMPLVRPLALSISLAYASESNPCQLAADP